MMRIGIVELDLLRLGGSMRTMLAFGDYWAEMGHDVFIYSNPAGAASNYSEDTFLQACHYPSLAKANFKWMPISASLVRRGYYPSQWETLDALVTPGYTKLAFVQKLLPHVSVVQWSIHLNHQPQWRVFEYWTNCLTIKNRLIASGTWREQAENLHVVHPPHDYTLFRQASRLWDTREFDVVTVGALTWAKGLLEVDQLCARHGLRSLIIGARRGIVGSQSEEVLAALTHSEVVVDAELATVAALVGNSRVYLCMSYDESCPLVIYEAMNAGCVPVTRDVGGVRDQVGADDCVFEDAIAAPGLVCEALASREARRAYFQRRGCSFDRCVVGQESLVRLETARKMQGEQQQRVAKIIPSIQQLNSVGQHYGRDWEIWDQARVHAFHSRCGPPLVPIQAHAERIQVMAQLVKGPRVLDVGCGLGYLYGALPASICYEGCDSSPAMLAAAMTAWPGVRFFVSDVYTLAGASSAEVICAHSVLTHLPNVAPALQTLLRHTDCYVIVNMPLVPASGRGEEVTQNMYMDDRYLLFRRMTRKAFLAVIEACGGIVDTEIVHQDPQAGDVLYVRIRRA